MTATRWKNVQITTVGQIWTNRLDIILLSKFAVCVYCVLTRQKLVDIYSCDLFNLMTMLGWLCRKLLTIQYFALRDGWCSIPVTFKLKFQNTRRDMCIIKYAKMVDKT